MNGKPYKARDASGSLVCALNKHLAGDNGIREGVWCAQRSIPRTVDEFLEIQRELSAEGVTLRGVMMIPVEEPERKQRKAEEE